MTCSWMKYYFLEIDAWKDLHLWEFGNERVPDALVVNNVESSFHLFFRCSFVVRLWYWFAHSLNMEDIWKLCDMSWSPQCKIVIKAILVNLLNIVWFARNQARLAKHYNLTWIGFHIDTRGSDTRLIITRNFCKLYGFSQRLRY